MREKIAEMIRGWNPQECYIGCCDKEPCKICTEADFKADAILALEVGGMKWISVEDELPEFNEDVAIWSRLWNKWHRATRRPVGANRWHWVTIDGMLYSESNSNVTHWMRIEAPE